MVRPTLKRLTHGAPLGRGGLLLLAALTFGPVGCTRFQTIDTSHWFDLGLIDPEVGRVSHVEARWDERVRTAQDSLNGGKTLAGMAGRIYLHNDETHQSVDATGRVVVQMHDMTNVQPGQAPQCIAEWTFNAVTLKSLKRRDFIGEGYTLFLPWESYHPSVKRVELRVCYVADEKAPPFFAEPTIIVLRTEDRPQPAIQERLVPASNLVPKR